MLYKQIKKISEATIKEKLNIFFKEDQTEEDITTNTLVNQKKEIKALFIAEFSGVFCGINIIENSFSKQVIVKSLVQDGFKVKPETPLAIIRGPADEILRKERVILTTDICASLLYCVYTYETHINITDFRRLKSALEEVLLTNLC